MPVKTVNDIFLLLENFDVEAEEREREIRSMYWPYFN